MRKTKTMDELCGLSEEDFHGVAEPDDVLMATDDSEVLRYRASIQSDVDSFIKTSKKLERLQAQVGARKEDDGNEPASAVELEQEMEIAREQLDKTSRIRSSSYALEWQDSLLCVDIRQTGE